MKFQKTVSTLVFLSVSLFQTLVIAQLTADFSLDSSNFFSNNPQARSAVEAAVADLNAALNQNLGSITAEDQTITRSFQTATVNFSLIASVTDPSSGDLVDVSVVSPESVVRIFYGARPLSTDTSISADALGVGGPGSWGLGVGFQTSNVNDVGTAVDNAADTANLIYSRGEGPLISLFDSAISFEDGPSFPYLVNVGLAYGQVALNSNTTNFQFDHTIPVAPNLVDLYSVALHEGMHAIGMGPSRGWDAQVSGAEWTGDEVMTFLGSRTGALSDDGNHIASNLRTPRIKEGRLQQSVLAPAIPQGMRLELTEIDLAFMRDIGFAGAVVPPRQELLGDFDLDGAVDLADLDRFNTKLGMAAVGPLNAIDLDGSGTVDQADFEQLYTTLVETSNGSVGTAAGDVDLDGVVDVLNDAFILIGNLGSASSSWSEGDMNADGTVDVLNDAFLLIGNLGANNN